MPTNQDIEAPARMVSRVPFALRKYARETSREDDGAAIVLSAVLDGEGTIVAAARRLGVSRMTVARWMRQYGVQFDRSPGPRPRDDAE